MIYVLLAVAAYAVAEAVGWLFHRWLHSRWSNFFNRAHNEHHRLYTPWSFTTKTYKAQGDLLTFGLLAVVVIGISIFLLPYRYGIPFSACLLMIGFVNTYVHDALHTEGHWLEQCAFFWRWRKLHVQHHVDVLTNLGIFAFEADKAAGSYR